MPACSVPASTTSICGAAAIGRGGETVAGDGQRDEEGDATRARSEASSV